MRRSSHARETDIGDNQRTVLGRLVRVARLAQAVPPPAHPHYQRFLRRRDYGLANLPWDASMSEEMDAAWRKRRRREPQRFHVGYRSCWGVAGT